MNYPRVTSPSAIQRVRSAVLWAVHPFANLLTFLTLSVPVTVVSLLCRRGGLPHPSSSSSSSSKSFLTAASTPNLTIIHDLTPDESHTDPDAAHPHPHPTHGLRKVFTLDGKAGECLVFQRRTDTASSPHRPRLLYFIPGNPGLPDFYETFAREIFDAYDRSVTIIVASHVNHAPAAASLSPSDQFHIQDQVDHHIAVVKHLLSDPTSPLSCGSSPVDIALMGHSIGAYIGLRVLDALHTDTDTSGTSFRLLGTSLLFPTFSHMTVTRNGKQLTPVLRNYRPSAVAVTKVLALLPARVKQAVGRVVVGPAVWDRPVPHIHRAVTRLMHPTVAANATFMGHTEMDSIREPPVEVLAKHQSRLSFLYAASDDWVHDDEPQWVSDTFPDSHVVRSTAGVHAFILHDASHDAALEESLAILQRMYNWQPTAGRETEAEEEDGEEGKEEPTATATPTPTTTAPTLA